MSLSRMSAFVGQFSSFEFGRDRLPRRAIIGAGVYSPGRMAAFRRQFDRWERIRGQWVRYSFARCGKKEYAVLFGVYGAAMMLETVQLLRDGGVRSVYMVGSMGARSLPIGTVVVPTSIEDRAGVVVVDNPHAKSSTPNQRMLDLTRNELEARDIPFSEGKVVSVPAVLHGIDHLEKHVRGRDLVGHEMEGSTFLHFTRKHGVAAGALFYVSDNEKHSIIAGAVDVRKARRRALLSAASVAVAVLQHF